MVDNGHKENFIRQDVNRAHFWKSSFSDDQPQAWVFRHYAFTCKYLFMAFGRLDVKYRLSQKSS